MLTCVRPTLSRYISARAKKCEHLSDLLLHKGWHLGPTTMKESHARSETIRARNTSNPQAVPRIVSSSLVISLNEKLLAFGLLPLLSQVLVTNDNDNPYCLYLLLLTYTYIVCDSGCFTWLYILIRFYLWCLDALNKILRWLPLSLSLFESLSLYFPTFRGIRGNYNLTLKCTWFLPWIREWSALMVHVYFSCSVVTAWEIEHTPQLCLSIVVSPHLAPLLHTLLQYIPCISGASPW